MKVLHETKVTKNHSLKIVRAANGEFALLRGNLWDGMTTPYEDVIKCWLKAELKNWI